MIEASSDTIRSRSRTGKPSRQLGSADGGVEGEEELGALPMPLQSLLSEPALRRIDVLAEQGNPGAQALATYWVGQGVGLMNKATTVREVIYEWMQDFASAAERLAAMFEE
jgi:NAD(P)H-dependent flavin oxidoreductase YrpB (nitropropane dioxygenase family)